MTMGESRQQQAAAGREAGKENSRGQLRGVHRRAPVVMDDARSCSLSACQPAKHPAPKLASAHLTLFSCCWGGGRRSRRGGGGPSLATLASQSGPTPTAASVASSTAAAATPAAEPRASGVRAGEEAADSGAGSEVRLPMRRIGAGAVPPTTTGAMPPAAPPPPPPAPPAAAAAAVPPLGLCSSPEEKPVRSTLPLRLWEALLTLPDSHS